MKLLIIDNYDSFTYNLVHYVEPFVDSMDVVRNDEILLSDVEAYDAIILSPGPGTPQDTGISIEVVKKYAESKKILGVCMGMQVIVEAFGGKLRNLDQPLHGIKVKTMKTKAYHGIFEGIPEEFETGRYHSWVADESSLPSEFQVTAIDSLGLIQAIKHRDFPLSGLQFHPESVLTDNGKTMIDNWIRY